MSDKNSLSPSEAAAKMTAELAQMNDASLTALMIVAAQIFAARGIGFARQDDPNLLMSAAEAVSRGDLEVEVITRIPTCTVELRAVTEAGEPAVSFATFKLPGRPSVPPAQTH
jgi:hypothetical protein